MFNFRKKCQELQIRFVCNQTQFFFLSLSPFYLQQITFLTNWMTSLIPSTQSCSQCSCRLEKGCLRTMVSSTTHWLVAFTPLAKICCCSMCVWIIERGGGTWLTTVNLVQVNTAETDVTRMTSDYADNELELFRKTVSWVYTLLPDRFLRNVCKCFL